MSRKVKDCALGLSDVAEKLTRGRSFTSLTRAREPLAGDLEGKETVRS